MQITGTHVAYLHICHRKLWLFANGISMEHTSDAVAEGKLIGETTYIDRARKFTEVEIDGVKIDFYDAKNKVVHEVKKSASIELAHLAQVKYYLFKLEQKGVDGVTGIIEYPKLKQKQEVPRLTKLDKREIEDWEKQVEKIVANENCPEAVKLRICKSCSYFDFCYSNQPNEG